MATIKFVVDGKPVSVNAVPKIPLLYALRDDLKLKNPHFGGGVAQCGACTVCCLPVYFTGTLSR